MASPGSDLLPPAHRDARAATHRHTRTVSLPVDWLTRLLRVPNLWCARIRCPCSSSWARLNGLARGLQRPVKDSGRATGRPDRRRRGGWRAGALWFRVHGFERSGPNLSLHSASCRWPGAGPRRAGPPADRDSPQITYFPILVPQGSFRVVEHVWCSLIVSHADVLGHCGVFCLDAHDICSNNFQGQFELQFQFQVC